MRRAALLLLTVGLLLVGLRVSSTTRVTPYDLASRSVEENAAMGRPEGLEPVKVGSLSALMRKPVRGHAWLLYWAGNTSTYFKEATATIGALQLPPEIGVLVVAPPGYDSEGHPSPQELERDAVKAREWLRREQGAERIVTGGFSMGMYSALVAAKQDVAATFVMGTAKTFDANDASPLIRIVLSDRYQVRAAPPKVPALVIQGECDFPDQGRQVAAWLGARLVLIPGIGHVETQRHPLAILEARAFIEQALVPGS